MAIKHVIRAIKIKMMLNRLSKAKENALRELIGLPPKMSWYEQCTSSMRTCIKDKFCQTFTPCCVYDVNRHLLRPSCWTSPSFKEFLGFLGGTLMTLLLYLVMLYQMDLPPVLACTACMICGLVLTLTMAFSDNIRCFVLLMLPQFFSDKGRMLLLIYALFLAMNHPLNNVRTNINVMAQSATCGQEMALNGTKELVKAAVAPMQSIMDSVKEVLSKLVEFANMMKKTYNVLKQTVSEIGSTIKRVGQWLASMVDRCNDKMGSPYRKCKKVFDDAVQDCRDDLGPMDFLCEIAGGFDILCNIVRVGELLCLVVDAIKTLIQSTMAAPTQRVLSSAQEMFYFNVTIDYHFNYTMTQSKSYTQIKNDISKKILSDLDGVLVAIRVFRNMMFLTAMFIIIKAWLYRKRWMSEDRFDNIYITFTVKDLDERRKQNNKPGILPLNFDEEQKYIESLSGHMIPRELRNLAFGLVLYITSLFNAAFYLMCDLGLYSALRLIEKNFGIISQPPVPPHTNMHVSGEGPMADMYKSVIGMFDPLSDTSKANVDVAPCVPHPSEPDWSVYKLIASIYVVCLLLTITEAYGLRLRHVIMACYFQRRERMRAIWLFNHILKTRGGILENARSNMKKSKMGDVDTTHISLKGRLAANYSICEKLLKCLGWEVKSCLYCGREGKPDDYFNFIHCAYYDCTAVYCIECYADLDNICAVCNNNVEIPDQKSSEELDSSLDEQQKLVRESQKSRRQKKIGEIKAERRPSKMLTRMRGEFARPEPENLRPVVGNEPEDKEDSSGDEISDVETDSEVEIVNGNRNNHAVIDFDGESESYTPDAVYDPVDNLNDSNNNARFHTFDRLTRDGDFVCSVLRSSSTSCTSVEDLGLYGDTLDNSSSDESMVSESSVESDLLDYRYQEGVDDVDTDANYFQPNIEQRYVGRPRLDLVSDDIFSDTGDSSDESGGMEASATNTRPKEPFMFQMRRT